MRFLSATMLAIIRADDAADSTSARLRSIASASGARPFSANQPADADASGAACLRPLEVVVRDHVEHLAAPVVEAHRLDLIADMSPADAARVLDLAHRLAGRTD